MTIRDIFFKGRYIDLLVALCAILILQPMIQSVYVKLIFQILFYFALISGLRAMGEHSILFIMGIILFILGLAQSLLGSLLDSQELLFTAVVTNAIFLILVATVILKHLFKAKEVHLDTLVGAVCVYLLIGLIWGLLYMMVEFLVPESFSITKGLDRVDFWEERDFYPFIYFSLVTMTTVGYGDISPITPPARTLATSEAILGQIYLTILVARLVGMHMMHKKE